MGGRAAPRKAQCGAILERPGNWPALAATNGDLMGERIMGGSVGFWLKPTLSLRCGLVMFYVVVALASVWPAWLMAPTASAASAEAFNACLAQASLPTWDLVALRLDVGRYRASWKSGLGDAVTPSAVADAAGPTAFELWGRHVQAAAAETALELSRCLLNLVVTKTSLAAACRPCIADDGWLSGVMGSSAEA
jgi:hypothetical protein